MRIRVQGDGHNINLVLPTNIIFSKTVARIAGVTGRKYAPEAMEGITAQQLETLFSEILRIKKKYGSWELVDVESSDGERVHIIL